MQKSEQVVKSFKTLGDLFSSNPSLRKSVDDSVSSGDVANVSAVSGAAPSSPETIQEPTKINFMQGNHEEQSLKNQPKKLKP